MKIKILALSFIFIITVSLISNSFYFAFLSLVLTWIIYQLLLSDHIFYNPKYDQYYTLSSNPETLYITDNKLVIPNIIQDSNYLIYLNINSYATGYFIDPYITIKCGKYEITQFFERASKGMRYINISPLIDSLEETSLEVHFSTKFCSIDKSCTLHAFNKSEIHTQKLIVIAPHADDAEIAAFGLYSKTDSHIVTLTAGEVEPKTFSHFSSNQDEASKLKGLVRAWDSLTVPVWGNQPYSNAINLGYFCMQLEKMKKSPDNAFQSLSTSVSDTRFFRKFNTHSLVSNQDGVPSWNNMVQDLTELIDQIKPTAIVTPHELLDSHPDHKHATIALREALHKADHKPGHLLLYTNHLSSTDMHPFGPAHSIMSLPPSPAMSNLAIEGIFSVTLSKEDQLAKAVALEMMHDLRRPIKIKKKLRLLLQSLLINRKQPSYGDDPYFRKAIRNNEFFIVETLNDVKPLCNIQESNIPRKIR